MPKRQPKSATIITGADPAFALLFQQYLQNKLPDIGEIHLIRYPRAEIALTGAEIQDFTEHDRFAIRDILETRARRSWICGSHHCLLIAQVACNRNDEYFPECQQFMLRGKETVEQWHLFETLCAACFTPAHELVEL